ncbi:hypothetical protein C942_04740 [Photobacterium marinum]|uniref:Uncharacterized protein n=1 Tax=Photobacterium marinum TaxID=1056511 RepID=L8JBW9_9GAMM|nr:hypothetical protein C942_04740 [Photobacterium marinum]
MSNKHQVEQKVFFIEADFPVHCQCLFENLCKENAIADLSVM